MGKENRPWQEGDYVLPSFGKRLGNARRQYWASVEGGIERGRRGDLVGGGLIRRLGGWVEAEKLRLRGQERIKSDERILGGSDFGDSVLGHGEEHYGRKCALRRRGYDLKRIAERVAEIHRIKAEEIFAGGRQRDRVEARSLFCYWAVREWGNSLASLAVRLEMSPAGGGYAAQRGEAIAKEKGYELIQ